jgi:hypothetical protein
MYSRAGQYKHTTSRWVRTIAIPSYPNVEHDHTFDGEPMIVHHRCMPIKVEVEYHLLNRR